MLPSSSRPASSDSVNIEQLPINDAIVHEDNIYYKFYDK